RAPSPRPRRRWAHGARGSGVWTALPAYTIPVGVGVLVLVELFGKRVTREARMTVRVATLLVMLGSTAYYALLDEEHSITFVAVLGGLCLVSLLLAGLLRVRVFAIAGMTGLFVDLALLVYRTLREMERGHRMTIIGGIVLAVGAALIFGTVYYKANRETLTSRLEGWKHRLGSWD
ncbi:MAG: hypothetical protein AAF517_12240, partial [Planctomycetota bacterium]